MRVSSYEVIDDFYKFLNSRKWDKLELLFTHDAIYSDPDFKDDLALIGKKTIVNVLSDHMNVYSKVKIEVNKVSMIKNQLRVKWTLKGIIKADFSSTKKEENKTFSGYDLFKINNDRKISDIITYWDPAYHPYRETRQA
jgi:hypothetical protein